MTLRTILHPTDCSDSAARALEVAARFAATHRAELLILHAELLHGDTARETAEALEEYVASAPTPAAAPGGTRRARRAGGPRADVLCPRRHPAGGDRKARRPDRQSPARVRCYITGIVGITNVWPGSLTVSTGHGALRTTFSATLPSNMWLTAPRPWVPITIRSISFSRA